MALAELTCIVCPRSCKLQISADKETLIVTGNACKRGAVFAQDEMTDPRRTICSTVATVFPEAPVLPVRVSDEIPKAKIFDVMREINRTVVKTRIGRGDVVIKNVLGLGADVIATSDLLKEKAGETS